MPEPKIRVFLHSVAAANGHRVIYLSLGVGEKRPVRQATGYAAHLAYFSPTAPHLGKGADGYRSINEKLDELRLAVAKACRRLEDANELSNAALAPLLKAAVAALAGQGAAPSARRAQHPAAGPASNARRAGGLQASPTAPLLTGSHSQETLVTALSELARVRASWNLDAYREELEFYRQPHEVRQLLRQEQRAAQAARQRDSTQLATLPSALQANRQLSASPTLAYVNSTGDVAMYTQPHGDGKCIGT